jgi:hypothetical protein
MKNIKYLYISLAFLLMSTTACTDLEETVYNDVIASNYYNNKTEVMAAVLRPFTHANAWATPTGQLGYWRISELSADQLAWPQKGRHGYDGGDWIRLHRHEWVANENSIWNPWRLMWWGLGFCNTTVEDLTALDFTKINMTEDDKASIIAETKVLRAWHYIKLMDLYGNIPIVTKPGQPISPPTQSRAEVFAFIEKELKDNVELLKPLSASLVGRVTKAGGYAMLAELYLNAQVWSGTERFDDCITYCNKIIAGDGGSLSGTVPGLESDIYKPFNNVNHTSKENLFQITYDHLKGAFRFGWEGDFWHYQQRGLYNADRDGNNGIVVVPSAFDAYETNDLRKSGWFLIGVQYKHPSARRTPLDTVLLGTEEYAGKPLVFVNEIRKAKTGSTVSSMTEGEENSGARFAKYVPGQQTDANYWGNDFVLYRMGEIYLNKAEAIMRKNNGVATQEVVDLVNAVRQRAFTSGDWPTEQYNTATLTIDELLAERGRELVFEGKRRTDLIRFGKFTTASWWDHAPSNDKKWELFPIPDRQIVANKELDQNPGY